MSSNYDYDVLYLGGGHAAFDGAGPLAAVGKKVAVIEGGLWGGTCPNRGCNAKITLDAPVVLQRLAERMQGIVSSDIKINWSQLVMHKQEVIEKLPTNIAAGLTNAGVKLIHGYGKFKDKHTILVDNVAYTAEKIVIATGLRPNRLNIPGNELAHTSDDFMKLEQLPKRIAIIGSGYISMEFATIANAVGAEVTIFMHHNVALRNFYQPFVQQVVADMQKRGISFVQEANIKSFKKVADKLSIQYGNEQVKTVDWILDATGRIANVENLNLAEIGIKYTKKGITVNQYLQTNIENIYAAGDVLDKLQPKLTPTATFESYYLYKLFSEQTADPITYPAIPSTVYTSPRIAKVGLSPDSKDAKDMRLVHNKIPNDWYRQIDKQTTGESILIFDEKEHLVGATEFSEQAEDAINTLLPAVVFNYTKEQMWQLAHIFPSISASAWHKIR
ncbi:NAD(P)/FAD-dependent oxidoreductase [Ligilactobacillus sp. WILCCON 0076]|uniref:NAD(P)/FAD-dependent oxidoreductase n=1 Tax=Ligilactobacillus ubinensis TaxID=2876789 RepID=A0A9X2FKC5_9LACO|nr:NAD(P)/FAD-dependent oxidoreductase [Ligilactobacillus ubinensis]MCP0886103.1 NAD(P)/FAD-dependent oxidoreductase [Ligilactobacillus ubinensis]